jgi:hypothetical protein
MLCQGHSQGYDCIHFFCVYFGLAKTDTMLTFKVLLLTYSPKFHRDGIS